MLVPAAVVAQAPSPHFQVLHAFNGSDGDDGFGGVVLDAAGNLYGATAVGGDLNCSSFPPNGCGVVFELSATGKEKVLHKFTGPDGLFPIEDGILSRDSKGNIYGLNTQGGAAGLGTVFKIDKNGKGTVLYSFSGFPDGSVPMGLVEDAAGNFYGTTAYGGINGGACGQSGCGVVFKLSKTGKETVLHSFTGSNGDGNGPYTILVQDKKGDLYGTAF
jgi:uncharacterized repeat protein (TIGR03803 family)